MQVGVPSRTALAAAAHRAAHRVLERGRIFAGPLAARILGSEAEPRLRDMERDPTRLRMRIFIAVRAGALHRDAYRRASGWISSSAGRVFHSRWYARCAASSG